MNAHVKPGHVSFAADIARPLVVDLDGTLIRSDLLIETFFAAIGKDPLCAVALAKAGLQGKAALKTAVARRIDVEAAGLPYNPAVLDMIRDARAQGRPVYLASASHEKYVAAVSDHLDLFEGWFASNATRNLSGAAKAALLVETFGKGGFDYAGNDTPDLAVWAQAGKAVAVDASPALREKLLAIAPDATVLRPQPAGWRVWAQMLRVHQYAKNALVLIPLLASHSFDAGPAMLAAGALLAFSLCASSVYILNDLVDIAADRAHPGKRKRPLAAGTLDLKSAVLAIPVLLAMAVALATAISPVFLAVLAVYFALTTAYTFVLKRKMLVDVVALAMLYTIRVIGGAAAINVLPSEWLLGFSLFFFTSLALIKRYIELAGRLDADLPDPGNRNYKIADLPIVATLAAATGCNAITVFALYISSDAVRKLYHHPLWLWLICPVLMYWISRALFMAHRRLMHDDPIVFALADRNSIAAAGLIGAILLAAM